MQPGLTRALAVTLTLVPSAALAHTGHGDGHGFVHGFAHPLGGLDHVLATLAAGFLAWQLVRRALALLPATFAVVMALAAAFGISDMPPQAGVGYAAGFMAATALLYAGGLALGFAVTRRARRARSSPLRP